MRHRGSYRDLIFWSPHHLPILPPLLVGDQPSLLEDVVQEGVYDHVVPGVDFPSHLFAAADDVLRIERKSSLAAPTLRFGFLLRDEFVPPLPDAEEVLRDL